MSEPSPIDLTAIREKLRASRGPQYWRSLEELAETEDFKRFIQREVPFHPLEDPDSLDRRQFLKLMASSLAMAGAVGCTPQKEEKIVPYVRAPENIVPGKPLFYATAMPLAGYGIGVLAESHMGRPTKIEGNPDHPASLGATDVFAQASILDLYDPDRSQVVTHRTNISTWATFLGAMRNELEEQKTKHGAGIRILTGTETSPTLGGQIRDFLKEFPEAKWHCWEPAGPHNAAAGIRRACGQDYSCHYRFDKAKTILSLDSNFLGQGPASVRYSRDFTAWRGIQADETEMNRLYAFESGHSITGSMADHRFASSPREIMLFLITLGRQLGVLGGDIDAPEFQKHAASIVAGELRGQMGTSLIIAGESQSSDLVLDMNYALGNFGKTIIFTEPIEQNPGDQVASLQELVGAMEHGKVELLLVLESNPVFTAPADMNFAGALQNVRTTVHLGLTEDETSYFCHWHVPGVHYLESWGDVRAYDGTVSIIQPLIEPLYGGKSAHELLAALMNQTDRTGYEIVRSHWQLQTPGEDFEQKWRSWLHDGVIPDTAMPPKTPTPRSALEDRVPIDLSLPPKPSGYEFVIQPDPSIFDGRFANNGWLQELPKPITKLTWDNAIHISPGGAQELGLQTGDLIEARAGDYAIEGPVLIVPGHARDCVTLHLGYGRTRSGHVGNNRGFDSNRIRTGQNLWNGAGLQIRKLGGNYDLATTQHHFSMEGRDIVRAATLDEFKKNPEFAHREHEMHDPLSLYPAHEYTGYAWGMAIDQNKCTGCNACVIACQAENNIPIVGKEMVARGREMHWIRIDGYFEGNDLENTTLHHQPMLCQHCETAPCEPVCPVHATVHSSEGLNDMVYNRCVGTRYCSNNCPYKVRRFNFLLYNDWNTESLKMARNPDVTVRSRGVMEKCTYCVQRISAARIESEKEDRPIRDGEIVTACQAACPSRAIIFGNINDPESQVSKIKANPRNYGVLADLNTRPRTTYLAKVRNPNPEIREGGG